MSKRHQIWGSEMCDSHPILEEQWIPLLNFELPRQLNGVVPSDFNYNYLEESHNWNSNFNDANLLHIEKFKPFDFNCYLDDSSGHKTGKIDEDTNNQKEQIVVKESTNTTDINHLNEEFYKSLLRSTSGFVWELKHTDFQDGMENNVTLKVKHHIEENKYVTYVWLSNIFSNNQEDEDIVAGLLRVIGMVITNEDVDSLLPIVRAGLADVNPKTQEAALMVIEQWRTKNCLAALKSTTFFSSPWLNSYAKQIERELNEELSNVITNG